MQETSPTWLSGGTAIELAVEWMDLTMPVAYGVDPNGCNAIWLNGRWAVTCLAAPMGCNVAACEGVLAVCVYPSRPIIVTDERC
jgi:hypothetical protein